MEKKVLKIKKKIKKTDKKKITVNKITGKNTNIPKFELFNDDLNDNTPLQNLNEDENKIITVHKLTDNTLENQQDLTQIQKIIENTLQNDQNKPQIEQNIENTLQNDQNKSQIEKNVENTPNIDQNQIELEKEKKEFMCVYCKKVLACKRNLDWHESNVCQFRGKYICPKCNKSFLSGKYLTRHKNLCLGELKCPKCNKILSRKQTYLKHIKKCNANIN